METPKYDISFLINPISGGGLGRFVFNHLEEIMESFGYAEESWTAVLTKEKEMENQCLELLKNSKKLIAVGGDGTIGLILSQLTFNPFETEIGLIPLGTGNDLGRSLGIYKVYHQRGLIACFRRLIRANSTVLDLWTINKNTCMAAYFSIGLDGAILHDFDSARKQKKIPKGVLFNKLYFVKSFFNHLNYKIKMPITIEVESEGENKTLELKNKSCVLIGNINSYAGGANLFPNTLFNDEKLEILIFNSPWELFWMGLLGRVVPKLIPTLMRKYKVHQGEKITIHGLDKEFCQLDGEDVTGKFSEHALNIDFSQKAKLMDLRRSPFEIF